MKKLIPALALLLISAVLLSTASFAWFSMNTTVTVTGMQVNTTIKDSLSIASDTLDSTAKKAENNFKNGMNQSVTGLLEPVSTINGTAFFYTPTSNVQADGDAIEEIYTAYAAGDTFDGNYGLTDDNDTPDALGYVDYVFQLKAINTNPSVAANVKMTRVNLLYNNLAAAGNEIKAFRVAVFVEDITSDDPAGGVGTLKTVLRQSGALYRAEALNAANKYAVGAANTAPNTNVSLIDTAATLAAVPAATTKYYKVVVRMWIEGEDTMCNNATFLSLTKNWTLDLALELGTGDGVANINSVAGAVATSSEKTASVTLSDGKLTNGETPVSYQWKLASDDSNIAGATAATYTNDTVARDIYCVITTTRGSIYTTNTVSVAADE